MATTCQSCQARGSTTAHRTETRDSDEKSASAKRLRMERKDNALFTSFRTVKAILLGLQRLCFGILIDTNLCFGITKQRLSRDCENDKTTIRVNANCLLQQHNLGDKQTGFCFDFVFPLEESGEGSFGTWQGPQRPSGQRN